ncbi:indolepyruvate ferredoxin oxidoreductase subunit alpha [uncultured Draconibacterium sp.]|uniref:indolepyruvate ferredoxin oxidoreductase subunit alpha n=1 Tax=uncultured Draconibacterium sp. TaxID=1573823 RepID=UPI002AA69634|nr:indolepyruvate ferredoxin oxidoreductase subunit alpha [uncultured Draconibacterium sp.]
MMKIAIETVKMQMMNGNEAVARGAFEAGVKVAAGFPGTPSTEVMDYTRHKYPEIYCEWSTNEKVGLEVAIGASFAGYRSLAIMKTVGLHVAADALGGAAGSQINGGLVLVVGDDVGRIAGDDYNDVRHYGNMFNIPVLEPSDSQEAKDLMVKAFEISEEYSTPVILKITSVICKTTSKVVVDEDYTYEVKCREKYPVSFSKVIMTTIMMKAKGSEHPKLTKCFHDFPAQMKRLAGDSNNFDINKLELNGKKIGVITAGTPYYYVKEVLPEASILKLGLVMPLPEKMIRELAEHVDKLYVIEDGHDILEKNIKDLGIEVTGKELFPKFPEMMRFTPDIIEERLVPDTAKRTPQEGVPFRLPVSCAGCSHLFISQILRKHKIKAAADVTCGLIGCFPHMESYSLQKCMGSSIALAHGYNVAKDHNENIVAMIGDGGFWATGINGLMNLIFNDNRSTVIIVDNGCLAMTGGQNVASSEFGFNYKPENKLDIAKVCEAIGVKDIVTVDAYEFETLEESILNAVNAETNSVVIVKKPCVTKFKPPKNSPSYIDQDQCTKCRKCIDVGCLAIESKKAGDGLVEIVINQDICTGCGLCSNACKFDAIKN